MARPVASQATCLACLISVAGNGVRLLVLSRRWWNYILIRENRTLKAAEREA